MNLWFFKARTEPTPPCRCPNCGRELDAATNFRGAVPRPGDLSLCCYCATLLEFGADLHLTPKDIDTLPINLRIKVREHLRVLKEVGPPPIHEGAKP